MSKEAEFFIYLLERYADYKKDQSGITKLIYDLYDIYHVERLENAFEDIDKLVEEKSSQV